MSLQREIPVFPKAPNLVRENLEIRTVLTELVFGQNAIISQPLPHEIDTVFCFGSNEGHQRQGKSISDLFNRNVKVHQLIFTSGMDWLLHDDVPDLGQAISIATWRAVDTKIPPETKIGIDTSSTNTKENAVNGWAEMPRPPKDNIVISALTFHQGRCHRTLMAEAASHGWNGSILYYPYQALEREENGSIAEVRSDSWWDSPIASSRVWSETQRIFKYGSRGDIAFLPDDAQKFKFLKQSGLELVL